MRRRKQKPIRLHVPLVVQTMSGRAAVLPRRSQIVPVGVKQLSLPGFHEDEVICRNAAGRHVRVPARILSGDLFT